jgi:hypothetical protein
MVFPFQSKAKLLSEGGLWKRKGFSIDPCPFFPNLLGKNIGFKLKYSGGQKQ